MNPMHVRRGAGMGNEEGWRMPQQFTSLMAEHRASRAHCGVFDVSHLGKFTVTGSGALQWLESMLSNSVTHCRDGMGQRTLLLQENGGIIDKLMLFRESAGRFFLLGHAAMAEEVYAWLADHRPDGPLELENLTDRLSGIGLYGPEADEVLSRVLPRIELPPPMGFRRFVYQNEELLLTHASPVMDNAYELFCRASAGISWYESMVAAGAEPCGMATRDCLRVEQGTAATGRDVGPDKTPVQASLGRFCDLSKSFIGSEALRRQSRSGTLHRMATVECEQNGAAPRAGDRLIDDVGATVGSVTSGCLSPAVGRGRALAYLARRLARPGTRLRLIIGGHAIPVIVTGDELW